MGLYLGSTGTTHRASDVSTVAIGIEFGAIVLCAVVASIIMYSGAKPIAQPVRPFWRKPNSFDEGRPPQAQPTWPVGQTPPPVPPAANDSRPQV